MHEPENDNDAIDPEIMTDIVAAIVIASVAVLLMTFFTPVAYRAAEFIVAAAN